MAGLTCNCETMQASCELPDSGVGALLLLHILALSVCMYRAVEIDEEDESNEPPSEMYN